MQYSHKKISGKSRIIYISLMLLGFFLTSVKLEGWSRVIFATIGVFALVTGLFFIVRYELTEFSIVVNAKENDFDFFINKVVGKRGAYDCYFRLSDAEDIVKLEKSTKKELKEKYTKVFFHNYSHNLSSPDRYVILFINDDQYEGVICELNDTMLTYLKNSIEMVKNLSKSPDTSADD